MSGFFSYTHAKYLEYQDANGHDLSFRSFGSGEPKYLAGASVSWNLPLGSNGDLTLRADISHRGENDKSGNYASSPFNVLTTFAVTEIPAYNTINLRADWKHAAGSAVDVGVFVNNASDKKYLDSGSVIAGIESGHYAPPRMFGIEIGYQFGDGFKPQD